MRRLASLLVVALLAGCDGYRCVHGRVSDADGKPVAGASVRLVRSSHVTDCSTDQNGRYRVGLVGSPTGKMAHKLTVSKKGFKNHSETIELTVSGEGTTANIVLERDGNDLPQP